MATVRQASFAGGELSPLLYGRPDLAKYAVGLKTCFNFFVSKQGQAVSRPGTGFLARTKATGAAAGAGDYDGPVRLVPFLYSATDTLENYVLEFGHHYVRFFKAGAPVLSGGSPYELSTPYAYTDLPYLKFTQSGDVLTLTHHTYEPRELRRYGTTSWVFTSMGFLPPYGYTINATGGYLVEPLPSVDSTHVPKHWTWAVSAIYAGGFGGLFETRPVPITDSSPDGGVTLNALLPNTFVGNDRGVTVHVKATSISIPNHIKGFLIYRGLGSMLGLVGSLDSVGDFIDYGIEPDYSQPPRVGTNPFVSSNGVAYWHSTAYSLQTADYPSVCCYFEERLTFGRTNAKPAGLFLSATADYYNFDVLPYPNDAMSIAFELAARRREEIRALVPLGKLLVFTNASVWAVGGANGPLAYNSVDAKVQLEVGANWVEPVVVDGAVVFARSNGEGLRALGFVRERDSFQGLDLSLLAAHVFEGKQVVDMAYAEHPWSVVWVVLDDGTLASLTLARDQDVYAWARHETPYGDKVEAVVCVPEGNEDAVYFSVARTHEESGETRRYVERMASRRARNLGPAFAEQPVCVDSAVSFHADSPTTAVPGLSHLEGRQVTVVGDGKAYGPFVVAGGSVTLPEPASNISAGLHYSCSLETLDPVVPGAETRFLQKVVNRVMVEVADAVTFQVGPDAGNLHEWRSRRVSDGYGAVPPRSEAAEVRVRGGWGPEGHVYLLLDKPFPLTVLGITREVEVGNP